jgi:hypothetical protein
MLERCCNADTADCGSTMLSFGLKAPLSKEGAAVEQSSSAKPLTKARVHSLEPSQVP